MDTGGYLSRNYHIDEAEKETMAQILEEEVKHRIQFSVDELNAIEEGVMARSAKPGEIPLSVVNTAFEMKKLYDAVKARKNKALTPTEEAVFDRLLSDLNDAFEVVRRTFPTILNPL